VHQVEEQAGCGVWLRAKSRSGKSYGAHVGHHLQQHRYGAGKGSDTAGSEGAGGRYHFRHSGSGKRGVGTRIISIYEEICLGGAQRVAPLYIGWSTLKALV